MTETETIKTNQNTGTAVIRAEEKKDYQMTGFYGFIEKLGNKIPGPAFMFIGLFIITYIASLIMSAMGVAAVNPVTGKTISVINLCTSDNTADFLQNINKRWMNFAPLLTVPVCTVGLAIASRTGLLEAGLRLTGHCQGIWSVALIVSFIGVNANLVGDAAFLIFPPLVAMLFKSVHRNPLAGLFLGYASVSVGFGANLLIGSADASLAGLTQAAAVIVDANFVGNAAMGWYYLFASTFIVTIVCAAVSIYVIEPRLAKTGMGMGESNEAEDIKNEELSDLQKTGMKRALLMLLLFFAAVALMCLPGMPFAAPKGGSITTGKLFKCIPTLIMFMFFLPGYAYGKTVGTIKKFGDTIPMITEEIKGLSGFIMVCLFASQFIAVFGKSNIATIIAIWGGDFLVHLGLPKALLLAGFVVMASFINLFMTGASGKWALISTMFVPMMMIAGINPAAIQVAYRMGDGLTNNIAPVFPYLAAILGYAQIYEPRARVGTVMAYMLPYTLITGVVWIAFLVIWVMAGLPVGPGYPALL